MQTKSIDQVLAKKEICNKIEQKENP